jgi:steroid 5-alpha reductase family enzyme
MIAIWIAAGLSLAMAGAWLVQRTSGNAGMVDVVWTFSLGGAGVVSGLSASGGRAMLVAALAAIWAIRLGLHILRRNWGAPEDSRYARLRANWGDAFQARMFAFLQVQALAAAVLAMSFVVAAHNPAPLGAADALSVALFAIGVAGSGLADAQLTRFRREQAHRGAVCDVGLWQYSRHPNYFFEFVTWCCWPLLAIAPHHAWGWVALSAPVLMYWLLVHVSGIPPLEEAMLRSRGDRYRAYQARTRAFFPLPKRNTT